MPQLADLTLTVIVTPPAGSGGTTPERRIVAARLAKPILQIPQGGADSSQVLAVYSDGTEEPLPTGSNLSLAWSSDSQGILFNNLNHRAIEIAVPAHVPVSHTAQLLVVVSVA